MHIHHYSLKKIARIVEKLIPEGIIGEAYTQERDQIVIGIGSPDDELWLRVGCAGPLPFVWPMRKTGKARKNVKDLFPELYGLRITSVKVVDYERTMVLHLEKGYSLVLKMHGLLSNVLVMKNKTVTDRFRHNQDTDLEFTLEPGDFDTDWEANLVQTEGQPTKDRLRAIAPIYDRHFVAWMDRKMAEGMDFAEAFRAVIAEAENDVCYIVKEATRMRLLLLNPDNPDALRIEDPEQALHTFFRSWFQYESYARQFEMVRKALAKHLKRYRGQIDSFYKSMDSIATTRPAEEFGHILMANLHVLEQGMKSAELFDFYQNEQIKIKLKPELNPQQNAEYFYKKQKKLRSRSGHIEEQIGRLEEEQASFLAVENEFSEMPAPGDLELGERGLDYALSKAMTAFSKKYHDLLVAGNPQRVDLKHPFHEYKKNGFGVFVGKNAKQNDRLTFQFSSKTDTWLHARDVTGSHVIIRNANNRDIPTDVLEFAAGLAAHFSKRKTEALVPVQYTERKYVRKVRDGHPGQVIVEKEKVVMVEPIGNAVPL